MSSRTVSMSLSALRRWVKAQDNDVSATLYALGKWWRYASLPSVKAIYLPLYLLQKTISAGWADVTRIVWYTPLFQSRLIKPAKHLYVYGGMPLVIGPVQITLGSYCRVGGRSNIIGRNAVDPPKLIIGNNVDLGWGSTLSVGTTIRVGNNVRLAANVFLAGFPGHPLNAEARAGGAADTEAQIGDIILEDDVWLCTGVCVLPGVTIGRGTVVGTGSVVTKSLPADVLAAGNPARVIRPLKP